MRSAHTFDHNRHKQRHSNRGSPHSSVRIKPTDMSVLQGLTENVGHEIARRDKYRMKIDYITVISDCNLVHLHNSRASFF